MAEAHKKSTANTLDLAAIGWLSALIFLAQLPHYFHLPWWVGLCGLLITGLTCFSWYQKSGSCRRFIRHNHLLSVISILAALAVWLHYGYFLGRDPCVAFLFLLTACKFAETRKIKDASLLICLSGFLLLTQYFYSQNIIAALVSLPAVVTLGVALFAIRRCEFNTLNNVVNPNNGVTQADRSRSGTSVDMTGDAKDLLPLVGKLLLQGAPIAAVLFLLFPRLPGPLWNLPDDASARTGLSDSMSPGSISSLSQSAAVAFRVNFDQAPPAPRHLYWRGPVLTQFDGRNWSLGRRLEIRTPAAEHMAVNAQTNKLDSANRASAYGRNSIGYDVMLQPNNQRWLFALENPITLPRSIAATGEEGLAHNGTRTLARLTGDMQLVTDKPLSKVTRYRQYSSLSTQYESGTSPSVSNTQIAGRNTRSAVLARELKAKSENELDYANRVLAMFREKPFFYTLSPPLLGDRPVDEFLFESRRGFCEHYASAFTYLMRAVGIPSRIVTGYQGGEMNGDYMIVRQSDAHAWSEVLINGKWTRFDPTAAVAPSRVEQGLASSLAATESLPSILRGGNSWTQKWQLRWDSMNHDWQRLVVDFNNTSQESLWRSSGLPTPTPVQLVVLVILTGAIWCLGVLHLKLPSRRSQTTEQRLWQRYCRTLARAGAPIEPLEGPVEYSDRVKKRWPQHAAVLTELEQKLLQLRYGNPQPETRQQLQQSTRATLQKFGKLGLR